CSAKRRTTGSTCRVRSGTRTAPRCTGSRLTGARRSSPTAPTST
ncbi:MAG: Rhodanese-related sulfurtransferase, partial [uncultured Rubrobacteraceae bacterium]